MPRKSNDNYEEDGTELEPERILVHKLVDSSKAQRTKAVERLKAWINARTLNPTSFFSYEDLIKIWKGLYYNMWMADKPILQVIISLLIFNLFSIC
jgi:ribosomal RNA-processing protein 1